MASFMSLQARIPAEQNLHERDLDRNIAPKRRRMSTYERHKPASINTQVVEKSMVRRHTECTSSAVKILTTRTSATGSRSPSQRSDPGLMANCGLGKSFESTHTEAARMLRSHLMWEFVSKLELRERHPASQGGSNQLGKQIMQGLIYRELGTEESLAPRWQRKNCWM